MANQDAGAPAPPTPLARQHGGRREGAGRRPASPRKLKAAPAYISLTALEKQRLEKAAAKRGLTLSFYLREKLGLPIE
jgi:hypothetical protein